MKLKDQIKKATGSKLVRLGSSSSSSSSSSNSTQENEAAKKNGGLNKIKNGKNLKLEKEDMCPPTSILPDYPDSGFSTNRTQSSINSINLT